VSTRSLVGMYITVKVVLSPNNDLVMLRAKLADRRLLPLSPDRLWIRGLRGRDGWK
jgi:hypothetical protein